MGTYLSTPVTDKTIESGDDLECPSTPLAWGVVDMQGWRKSMEDAHVADTNVDVPETVQERTKSTCAKVFGVFDGHGGPEVARFCQLYLVSVLVQQAAWHEDKEPVAVSPMVLPKETPVGKALASAFHALDRMIDDPTRRDEVIRLRANKPSAGESQAAADIPPVESSSSSSPPPPEELYEENDPAADNDKNNGAVEEEKNATTDDNDDDDPQDGDSNEAVGREEAAEKDQDWMMDDDDTGESDTEDAGTAGKVSVMFQRLLNMSGSSGQMVVTVNPQGQVESNGSAGGIIQTDPNAHLPSNPSVMTPSMIRNGRLICNLPDHPIHAGATAVVAVIVGRTITVANAGDSRAVLCRAGSAYPLSFDHKPLQERELTRIRNAGGFVNHFGRVNGNLNLSRSIGDLKYKQVPNIAPADQMITAEPDIIQVDIGEDDEFMILGCDGIWDCLTNEKAVEYVRTRLDKMTPTEIGVEMLDDIISEDPRATQGIGGDNMTVMIVDLKPLSRSYRRPDTSAIEDDDE